MRDRRTAWAIAVFAALLWGSIPAADAQPAFPAKPVRILIGFVPGGLLDGTARIVGQKLSEFWGQQVVVENRPGASGMIGAEYVAKSARDGYTLLMSNNTLTTNPVLYERYPYDPLKDFTAISLVAISPNVLVVHPSVPVKSIRELLALSRSRRVPLTQATAGVATPGHLAGELLQQTTSYRFLHVPYKGSGQALVDVLGGHVDVSFPTISAGRPFILAGKLRGLAVTSLIRSNLLPDMPTMSESGVPGFEVVGWYGLVGPPGLPRELLAGLSSDVMRAVRSSDVRDRLQKESSEPIGNTPEEFTTYMSEDMRKWAKVVKAANIRVSPL